MGESKNEESGNQVEMMRIWEEDCETKRKDKEVCDGDTGVSSRAAPNATWHPKLSRGP